MQTRMWMAAGACAVALVGAVASAGPASAKGIQSATISGPGLDGPKDVTPANGDGGRLATLTGFWDVIPGQPRPPTFTEQAPAGRLGPRYTITWRLMTGPEETTAISQELYPDAAGGPLVHTPAGQRIFEGTTVGGWYAAPFVLRDVLSSLGVPPAAPAPAKAARVSAVTPEGASPASPNASPWPAVIIAATAVVALAGAGGALAVRRARRRERVAVVPL
jgi:hypothetical protein